MKTCPVCDTPYPGQHVNCPTDGAVLIETRELAPSQVVRGKYRIIRKLGQGGMGVVYLAEHLLLGGQAALKFLAPELSRNPEFVKRFRNEARAAYQLRHPNIVEVTDLDHDEQGSLFIAMEYVAGPSLRGALREAKGPLPVKRALDIARGVASGLVAAHARGAVHRDIKPDNVLLGLEPGGGEQAKVLDFGIAVITEGVTNLSRTHGLLLTPEYAAPEQWRGMPAGELDGRADLYALGGILYEMLSGQLPFHAVNAEGWMFQHLQGVPEPLARLRPELPRHHPGLDVLVMRLLAREREQRFPTATALLEALALKPPVPPLQPAAVVDTLRSPAPASIAEKLPAATPPPAPLRTRSRIPGWAAWLILIVVGLGAGLAVVRLFWPVRATSVPVLTPGGGKYDEVQPVAISDSTPDATIHYTVDGRSPTSASPIYTQPLTSLPSGVVVRAMATAEDHKPSPQVSAAYIWSAADKPAPSPQEPSAYDQGKSSYNQKDYSTARKLFAQACDSGEPKACNYLGYLYAQGLGGPEDASKARAVYLNACDRGNLSSCASLGSLYQDTGNGSEARKYFQNGCKGGLAAACDLLRELR
jgi:eukaryotic-like serine/threonine-protein kinase